ncbi:neuroglobin [Lepeophtheirus salmonis]|uniref:neuroglobin n=1 Tax=Lepeophtheirus salmonis TaxID=72036 RepID=UPI001AE7DFFB|nr:hemoglobin-1-like [Lepeophtheirus salmonis]
MGNAGVKEKSNILGGRGPVVETIAQLQTHQAMSSQPKSSVDTTNYLSKKQKDLLKRAWVALHNNLSSVGMTTFIKMFETHPEALKFMIPKLTQEEEKKTQSNYSLDSRLDPWHSEKLREHAHRIMKTVSDVISLLNKDEEKIEEMLVALGGKHHGFGVHIEILELMGPHFISAIYPTLKETWTEELQEAWQCLFNYIIALMHIGFDQALLAKVKPTWINYFD